MRFFAATCVVACALLIGHLAHAQDQSAPAAPSPNSVPAAPVKRIRVGGNVQQAKLIKQVQPVYPETAKKANASGTVLMNVIVAKDGTVQEIQYVSGPRLLMRAAMEAVKQWQYAPTLLDGEPIEVVTTVSVNFQLSDAPSPAPASASGADPQFRADLLKLLDVNHSWERMAEMGHQIFKSIRPLILREIPTTPDNEKIADAFEEKFVSVLQSPEMTDKLVEIYAKQLTDDDLKGLIQFYESPAGQHFNAAMPQIMSESMTLGMGIGEGAFPRIWDELCGKYPQLKETSKVCSQHEPTKESLRLGDRAKPALDAYLAH